MPCGVASLCDTPPTPRFLNHYQLLFVPKAGQ